MLVTVLDGCTVGTIWEKLRMLRDAQDLSSNSRLQCKRNVLCRRISAVWLLNLISRLLIHDVPSGCARWRLGRVVFFNQQNKLNQEIAGTWVYISLLSTYTSSLFSSQIKDTASIMNYLDTTWLPQFKTFRVNIHQTTYTTSYFFSGVPSTTCNCIIMIIMEM